MHTSFRVTGVLSGVESSVDTRPRLSAGGRRPRRCISLHWLYQPTHADVMFSRSARVSIGPLRNGEPSRIHSVLIQPYSRLAQGIIERVADSPHRWNEPFKHQCIAVMYCGVLTSGIAVVDRVVERVALSGPESYRVAQCALDEAGVFDQRALPAGDQPGVGVNDERGVAESGVIGTYVKSATSSRFGAATRHCRPTGRAPGPRWDWPRGARRATRPGHSALAVAPNHPFHRAPRNRDALPL